MRLMKPNDLAAELKQDNNLFNVQAAQYKKMFGKHPNWFIHHPERGKTRIDSVLYKKKLELPTKTALYASNKLYYILRATNHNDSDIARLMASKSKHFKNVNTWIMFLNRDLFMRVEFSKSIVKPTLFTEFVSCGTKYLYLMRKWDKLDLSKESDYYEM